MKEEINEAINSIPNIDHKQKFNIGFADELFRGKKVRFVKLLGVGKNGHEIFIIVINESLSLWFYKNEPQAEWKFDGWEMGDYTDSWKDNEI